MTKRRPVPRETIDTGPAERRQHGDVIESHDTEQAGVTRAYVVTQTPLDRYFIRGLLGPPKDAERRQAAGNKLYAVFYRAGLANRTTADFEPRIYSGSIETYRILRLDSYNEYMKARDAIRTGCTG